MIPLRTLFDRVGTHFPGHTMQRVRLPDGRYRYTYASPGMHDTFGLDPVDIVGRDVQHEWVHVDDRPRFLASLEHSAQTLETFDEEVRIVGEDRSLKWVRSIGYPRRLPDGSVIWDGIAVDVTERREATELLERSLKLAKDAEAARAHLVSGVRAELLGPMTHIAHMLERLSQTAGASAEHALIDEMKIAVRRVLQSVASGGMNQPAYMSAEQGGATDSRLKLSPRQQEIRSLIKEGLSNRQIGERLGISEGTVKVHVASLLKRLGVRNRTSAVR